MPDKDLTTSSSHGLGAAHRPADQGAGVNGVRRKLCKAAMGGLAMTSAAALGYPFVSFLKLPKSAGPNELMEVPLDQLAEGQGVWGVHRGRQIVILMIDGEIRAFDGVCMHLGCIVRWSREEQSFICPCHGAVYDDEGQPVSGPINVGLRRVQFVTEDGIVKIRDDYGVA